MKWMINEKRFLERGRDRNLYRVSSVSEELGKETTQKRDFDKRIIYYTANEATLIQLILYLRMRVYVFMFLQNAWSGF